MDRLLRDVVGLSERRLALGPDALLEVVQALAARAEPVISELGHARVAEQLERFARQRFALVDEPFESAEAGAELETLAMVLAAHAELLAPALRVAVDRLSHALSVDGVPRLFGQFLKRLRRIARDSGDAELAAWVDGVVDALP